MTVDPVAILLVEDNPMDVELTVRAFKRNRMTNPVMIARDGQEALDYIHRQGKFSDPDSSPVPGLILLDIRLPRVDGLEVLGEIKGHAIYKQIPVVMLTTSQDDGDVSKSYDLGANSYIVKPVDFDKFIEVVGRIELYWILTNLQPPRSAGV
jgi:CheY-like chemotaxis protein